VPKRLEMMRDHFTYFLFTNVCRSLFEKDKLLFAFALAAHLGVASGDVIGPQLRFLLTGAIVVCVCVFLCGGGGWRGGGTSACACGGVGGGGDANW